MAFLSVAKTLPLHYDSWMAAALHIHTNLVAARKARGMLQCDLAAKVGASRQSVYRWESGAHISTRWLTGLAEVLAVHPSRLMYEEPALFAASFAASGK